MRSRRDYSGLMASAFRGLEGIYLAVPLGSVHALDVSGHIAGTCPPFHRRIGKAEAVIPCGKFFDSLTALTLIYDCMTISTVKPTAALTHKEAVQAFFNRCTIHCYHALP
jgi:hypothetical protein